MSQDKTVVFGKVGKVSSILTDGWRKKIIVIVVAVLILGLAGFAVYSHFRGPKNPDHVDLSTLTPLQKAQYFGDVGDYKAAQGVWKGQLKGAKTTADKVGVYYQQSALALKTKHYEDAKKYAEQAKKLAPHSNVPYAALAELAEAQGDKKTAKTNWQLAIDNLDPNTPGANLILLGYKARLGGTQ